MTESIRQMLTREASEAEAVAALEEAGELGPTPGQRARRRAKDPSQVYSVRIPVDRLEQLRLMALARGVAPTVLMRQFVLERLDQEAGTPTPTTAVIADAVDFVQMQKRLNKAVQAAVKTEIDAVKSSNPRRRAAE